MIVQQFAVLLTCAILAHSIDDEFPVRLPLLSRASSIATNVKHAKDVKTRAAKIDPGFIPPIAKQFSTFRSSNLLAAAPPTTHTELQLQNLALRAKFDDLNNRLRAASTFPSVPSVEVPVAFTFPAPPTFETAAAQDKSSLIDSFMPNLDVPVQLPLDLVGDAHQIQHPDDNDQHLQFSVNNFNHAHFPVLAPEFKDAKEMHRSELQVPSFKPLPASLSRAAEEGNDDRFDWLQHFSDRMRSPKPSFTFALPEFRKADDEDAQHVHLADVPQFAPLLPKAEQKFFRYSLPPEALAVRQSMKRSMRSPVDIDQGARAPTFNDFINTDVTIHKTWEHRPWDLGFQKPKETFQPHKLPDPGIPWMKLPPLLPTATASASTSTKFNAPAFGPLRPLSALTVNNQENQIFNNNAAPHSQQNIQISTSHGNSGSISQAQSTTNEFVAASGRGMSHPVWRGAPNWRKKRDIPIIGGGALPLASLFVDPNIKLDMPKTLDNLGTMVRNTFEDPNGPLFHVRNTVGSVRDAMLSALKIPHHELLVPTKYKIVEHVPEELVGDINPSLFDSEQGPQRGGGGGGDTVQDLPASFEGMPPFLNTYLKIGTMLRESIRSAQEALSHMGEVFNSAKKSVHFTMLSAPRVLKYAHVPVLKHQSPVVDVPHYENKLTLIGPKLLSAAADLNHDPANIHDDFVGVGRIMGALGVSNPENEKLGYQKMVWNEKIPMSQPGHSVPRLEVQKRPSMVFMRDPDHYKNKAAMKEQVGATMQLLQKAQQTVGATNLEDFFAKMKGEWSDMVGEDLTKSISENAEKLSAINDKLEEKFGKVDTVAAKSTAGMNPVEKLQAIAAENMEKFNALQRKIKERFESGSNVLVKDEQPMRLRIPLVKRQTDGEAVLGTGLNLPESLTLPYMGLVDEDELQEMRQQDQVGARAQEQQPNSTAHHFSRGQLMALEHFLHDELEFYKNRDKSNARQAEPDSDDEDDVHPSARQNQHPGFHSERQLPTIVLPPNAHHHHREPAHRHRSALERAQDALDPFHLLSPVQSHHSRASHSGDALPLLPVIDAPLFPALAPLHTRADGDDDDDGFDSNIQVQPFTIPPLEDMLPLLPQPQQADRIQSLFRQIMHGDFLHPFRASAHHRTHPAGQHHVVQPQAHDQQHPQRFEPQHFDPLPHQEHQHQHQQQNFDPHFHQQRQQQQQQQQFNRFDFPQQQHQQQQQFPIMNVRRQ